MALSKSPGGPSEPFGDHRPGPGSRSNSGGKCHVQQDFGEGGIVTPGDREATFQLINGVSLMGGYAGIGADDPDERNIELFESILSGDLLGNDLPDFVNNDENSWHVVTGSGTGDTAEAVTRRRGRWWKAPSSS